jgi:hypothetical protein
VRIKDPDALLMPGHHETQSTINSGSIDRSGRCAFRPSAALSARPRHVTTISIPMNQAERTKSPKEKVNSENIIINNGYMEGSVNSSASRKMPRNASSVTAPLGPSGKCRYQIKYQNYTGAARFARCVWYDRLWNACQAVAFQAIIFFVCLS